MTDNLQAVPETALVPLQDPGLIVVQKLHALVKAMRDSVLVEDLDYGVIPGTGDKPTLLQPGMEKFMRALNAVPKYIERCAIRDYERNLFHYEYECQLVDAETGMFIPGGTGIGLATSRESKWRWREAQRVCPNCQKETIKRSKFPPKNNPSAEPGWYCYAKLGGCGAEFAAKDSRIIDQQTGRTENPDIADQLNTICKIAQKRALGSAVKGAANVSEFFTVDLDEDDPPESVPGTATKVEKPASGQQSPPSTQKLAETPKRPAPEQNPPGNQPPTEGQNTTVWYLDKMNTFLDLLHHDGYITGDTVPEREQAAKALLPADKSWKDYPSGKEAADVIKAAWKAKQTPAQPKSAPKSKPAPKKLAGDALAEALAYLSSTVSLKPDMIEETLGSKVEDMTQAEFDAALTKALHVHHLPILVSEAKYTESQKGIKVIDLSNPLLTVRVFGGRTNLKKLIGDGGEEWGKRNELEGWKLDAPEQPYHIGTLKVWWKSTEAGFAQTLKVEVVEVDF